MRETHRASVDRLQQAFVRRIRVAKTDFDAERYCEGYCGNSFEAFRSQREQDQIIAGELAQLMNVFGQRIDHGRSVVGPRDTRLVGEEWSFDVPPGDGGLQQGRLCAQ